MAGRERRARRAAVDGAEFIAGERDAVDAHAARRRGVTQRDRLRRAAAVDRDGAEIRGTRAGRTGSPLPAVAAPGPYRHRQPWMSSGPRSILPEKLVGGTPGLYGLSGPDITWLSRFECQSPSVWPSSWTISFSIVRGVDHPLRRQRDVGVDQPAGLHRQERQRRDARRPVRRRRHVAPAEHVLVRRHGAGTGVLRRRAGVRLRRVLDDRDAARGGPLARGGVDRRRRLRLGQAGGPAGIVVAPHDRSRPAVRHAQRVHVLRHRRIPGPALHRRRATRSRTRPASREARRRPRPKSNSRGPPSTAAGALEAASSTAAASADAQRARARRAARRRFSRREQRVSEHGQVSSVAGGECSRSPSFAWWRVPTACRKLVE